MALLLRTSDGRQEKNSLGLKKRLTDVVDKPRLRVKVTVAALVHAVEIVIVERPLVGPFGRLQHVLRSDLAPSRAKQGISWWVFKVQPSQGDSVPLRRKVAGTDGICTSF